MSTNNDKPNLTEDASSGLATQGCSPLNDELTLLDDESWAVIYTDEDGWELQSMDCYSTYKLKSTNEEDAMIEAPKLAREIETRYL